MKGIVRGLLAGLILLAGSAVSAQDKPNRAAQPNVIILLADNLGYGDLSSYGGPVPTPRIDALAAEGVRFENFNTEAQCTPTRGALMTGRMPIRTGTFSVPLPGTGGHYGLAPWEYTIGELFSDAGYATAYFGKWHLGNVSGRVPTDQGFDQWWGISESSDEAAYTSHPLYPKDLHIPMVLQSVRGGEVEEVEPFDLQIRPFMDERITDRTLQFIRDSVAEEKPFFAYVGFTNMHPPLLPHPDFKGAANTNAPHPAGVAELDYRTGQVLDLLEELKVEGDTIVVWASDNAGTTFLGENMGTGGKWRGGFGGSWEGSIRAPAMVRWPGKIAEGVVTNEIVAAYDWMPTLAALVGESDRMPTDRPIDGVDMSAFLLGETEEAPRESFLFMGSDGQLVSSKWKTLKVHFRYALTDSWTSPYVKPQIPMVFDLVADPKEQIDLSQKDAATVWVIGPALKPMLELQKSAAEYPHVPVGADFEGYDQ